MSFNCTINSVQPHKTIASYNSSRQFDHNANWVGCQNLDCVPDATTKKWCSHWQMYGNKTPAGQKTPPEVGSYCELTYKAGDGIHAWSGNGKVTYIKTDINNNILSMNCKISDDKGIEYLKTTWGVGNEINIKLAWDTPAPPTPPPPPPPPSPPPTPNNCLPAATGQPDHYYCSLGKVIETCEKITDKSPPTYDECYASLSDCTASKCGVVTCGSTPLRSPCQTTSNCQHNGTLPNSECFPCLKNNDGTMTCGGV